MSDDGESGGGGGLMARFGKLSTKATRAIVLVVVLAVVVGVGAYLLFSGSNTRSLHARFTSAVGVYPGTPVEILGVSVGKVTSVHPTARWVDVGLDYDSKYRVPNNAIVVIVANSLVSDRYLQLAWPRGTKAPQLADGATIGTNRTSGPAELDDIYSALNRLSVALGPKGANKNGALSTFIKVSQANLQGNGAALGNSITKLSQAITTLSDSRGNLFGTVRNLQSVTQALSESDAQVKHFEEQLAQVSGDLASERTDLGAALHNLGGALDTVAKFVRDNQSALHTDLGGLKDITNILIKDKAALDETLAVAPVALANLVHLYEPALGALGTRSNLASVTDPANLCQVLNLGGLLDPVKKLLGSLTGQIASTCDKLLKNLPSGDKLQLPAGLDPGQLQTLLGSLLGGDSGLDGLMTGGS